LGRGGALALVVTGDAGIGKTTVWEAGLEAARQRGFRVLSTRASSAEARLSYGALIDLLDGVGRDELTQLPAPQLYALEVALHRTEPAEPPPEAAIALGFLNALRALANRRPVLVAVDDVPWLDAPSAGLLVFAARRLESDGPVFLLARRSGRTSTLEQAFGTGQLDRLEVESLSYGATRRLLSERLGLSLPRHVLRRLVDITLGNPLFALELGRELAERGPPAIGDDLPVPDAVEGLLGMRVARLPAETRRLLLATALSADLTTSQLGAIVGSRAVEDAVEDGMLLVDGTRVRPSHPLRAAAVKNRSRARTRRELHLALAGVVADEELRARHLALAAEGADETLAAGVAGAAAAAARRGAAREAAELAEHAFRLTPTGSAARSSRLLALAGYFEVAGEAQRVTDLLTPALDSLAPGAPRVRAQLLLSEGGGVRSVTDHQRHLESALEEAGDDGLLRAQVLAKRSIHATAACVERVKDAEAWALEALRLGSSDSEVVRLALHGLAWARALAGKPIADLGERFRAESRSAFHIVDSVDRVAGLRLTWRGEVAAAQTALGGLFALADERGESWSYVILRLHLCELALRAGDWDTATRLLDEWAGSTEAELLAAPSYERCRASLAAGRGFPEDVERWAAPALAGAEATGARWQLLETQRARGVAALLAHDPGGAVESLRAVWQHTQREGVDDPGAIAVAPNLVEALVESGELGEARAVTDRLRQLAEQQEHPWGRAAAKRCAGLISLAGGSYDEEAAAALREAADDYAGLGLRFDAAWSLLLLGRGQRRHRKWAAARAALERAVAAFDELGSPGWVAEARSELARVGARRPASEGALSPAEGRVAELAADGLSNKEIAQTLHVTVKTVEAHLSHAYSKLGVRSRSQLAARLRDEA
jgi:DNA-binding NarL/FixJ family response regulator